MFSLFLFDISGEVHELAVELEGNPGGGTIQLEVNIFFICERISS